MEHFQTFLEAYIFRVTAAGLKTRKLTCPKGYQPNQDGSACVPISGDQKMVMRKAHIKGIRSKKKKGAGYMRKVIRRQKKAMRIRTKVFNL